MDKQKLIRFEIPTDDIHIKPYDGFHVGLPNNDKRYLRDMLKKYHEDIDDYDGMWNESDYDWRIKNGDIFGCTVKDDKIISFTWSGNKITKVWDKNGCPVYNTPSFKDGVDREEIDYSNIPDYIYGYNVWVEPEYRGNRYLNIGLHFAKNLGKLGYKKIIWDVEIWNTPMIIWSLSRNGFRGKVIDLLG